MNRPKTFALGSLLAGLAVVLGAFGAHGLESVLPKWYDDPERYLEAWNTGVHYLMFHALAIIAFSFANRTRWLDASLAFLLTGMLLFSGCLFAWVLLNQTWLVMIVPIGGTAFIIGWATAAIGAWCTSTNRQ